MGERIFGSTCHGSRIALLCQDEAFRRVQRACRPPFQPQLVRPQIPGRTLARGLRGQVDFESDCDRLGDLMLDGEDVQQHPVVALAPQVVTVLRAHELGRNADAITGRPDAAFKQVRGSQSRADGAYVSFLATKGERRGSRRNPQAGDPHQGINDVIGKTVGEVLGVLVA